MTSIDNQYDQYDQDDQYNQYQYAEYSANVAPDNQDDQYDNQYDDQYDNMESLYMVDTNSSFTAKFVDGYSFRNLIEFLRGTNTYGSFRFSPTGITYQEADSANTIINQVEILASELIKYEYISKSSEIIVGVTIQDVRAVTRTIGKKDSLIIYKAPNDPMLYFQTVGNLERSSERANMCMVRPRQIEVINYEMPEYSNKPNCIVQASVFSKVCAAMASIKCRWIVITGSEHGITMKAMMENGVLGRVETLGDISENSNGINRSHILQPDSNAPRPKLNIVGSPSVEPINVKVKTINIKALSKLNNLCAYGTVKVYAEPGNPTLKINCKIGGYGHLNVYIRSPKEE